MNVEQNFIKGRDMFRETLDALEDRIARVLVNLYAEVIRSTSDEIVLTELEHEPRYVHVDNATISRYNIAVVFMGKDGVKYSKKARLSVKFDNSESGISFEKELL